MVRMLFDQKIIVNVFAGLCGLGLLIRIIVASVYRHLVKESDNPGEAKNKMLTLMKKKFETCYKLKIGVNNVDTFVDKNVLNYRFCGILLSTWDNFSGQVLFLSLLMVPVSTVFGVAYDCGQDRVLLTGAVGILGSAVLIFVDKSINLAGKKKMLRLNLLDYLENFCKVRLEQEAFHPEVVEQQRREFLQVAEAKKQSEQAVLSEKEEPKDELNRRKEGRKKKEEERKLQAMRREEEQKKLGELRKEEAQRKLEDRREQAARRREEELLKIKEEREAVEARRIQMKQRATQKQQQELKAQKEEENKKILHSLEEEIRVRETENGMDMLTRGIEELAAEKEMKQSEKGKKEQGTKMKQSGINSQEEKLIEDVLKEFFA